MVALIQRVLLDSSHSPIVQLPNTQNLEDLKHMTFITESIVERKLLLVHSKVQKGIKSGARLFITQNCLWTQTITS